MLYVGLDTVITRDITEVIRERIAANQLTLMRDFSYMHPGEPNSLFLDTYADGVTFVPAGGVPLLWEAFNERIGPSCTYPMHVFNTEVMRENNIVPALWQDIYPDFLCSYKWPTLKTECPPEAVVCFHGEPRPAQAVEQTPWLKEHWCE